jgi:hypothetical protein
LPQGEFPTFRGRYPAVTQEREFDSTTFATPYILHSLSYVELPRVRELVVAALNFLEAEMQPHGVWRYWTSRHPRHDSVPPDLDDTCCASAALRRFGRSPPKNEQLILANRNRAGLFYTWLAPRPARTRSRAYWSVTLRQAPLSLGRINLWRLTPAVPWDVDCVVNANVLHYLGDRAEATPVAEYLARVLKTDRIESCDKWHLNACVFYYAVSRAYAGGVSALQSLREPLAAGAEAALSRLEELSAAEVALAACALLNLDHRGSALDAGIAYIADTQREDGSWPAFALWSAGPEGLYGWGSEALTTGLCVESLARVIAEPAALCRRTSATS